MARTYSGFYSEIAVSLFCRTLCCNPLYTPSQNTGIRLLGNELPQSSIQYFGLVRLVLLDFSARFGFAKLRYNLAKQHPCWPHHE